MYKSGDSCLLTNYRPISVLPGIAKVFKSIVNQQVFSYFLSNNLLTPAQSGFQPGHSTQDLLLKVTEDWKGALDHDCLVSAVFIDLSKAFNSLDHSFLLAKLSGYDFDNNSLQWFTDYLSCQWQHVLLDHTFSDWATVVRGVPQGSVLGPSLFSICMNDLPGNMCHSQIALFADDIAMYVTNADATVVHAHINSDLALLSQWATTNGFKINTSKCQSMVLARRCRRSQLDSIQFFIGNVPLLPQKCVKYLGVLVDQELNWSQQVYYIRKKSLAALAIVRRVRFYMYLSTKVLISLYNAFVLSHLTDCCVVWHFCSSTLTNNLQRVQNYAMRIILKRTARTSSEFCLRHLGWLTLFHHHCIALLWQVHKCYLHLAPTYLSSKFITNCQFGYSHTHGSENFHLSSPKSSYLWEEFINF